MTELVTIASNAVVAKLHEPSREVKLEVQSILSYAVEGAENMDSFKTGAWDGRSSFLNFRAGTFPAGFVQFVGAKLRRKGYRVNFVARPLPAPLGPVKPVVDSFPEDPRYDYQMEVVDRLTRHGQIIAQVATGGGKSRIARLAFARINRPTLFLTTRGILMYQMRDTFEKDLKIGCTVLGDGQFGTTDENGTLRVGKMSVGMVQTLVSRLEETSPEREFEKLYMAASKRNDNEIEKLRKRLEATGFRPTEIKRQVALLVKKHEADLRAAAPELMKKAEQKASQQAIIRAQTIKLLALFEFVILEEAHEASGNSYYEILRHCKNAHYRLALTGTPFMKDSEESNMRLMASSGPIAIKISEKMLIDRGILATPKFKIAKLMRRPKSLFSATSWQSAYRLGIVSNEERNQIICDTVKHASLYVHGAMVLVSQKKHGEDLYNLLTNSGLRVEFIQGEDDQTGRKRALFKLENGEIDVLIGTTILDVGVDVPAVGLIVLAGGGKAEVALRQRIGRGLRAKKRGPNYSFILDFNDPFNNHTKQHAMQRERIIRETEGFGENIVPFFDFEGLGFVKKAA